MDNSTTLQSKSSKPQRNMTLDHYQQEAAATAIYKHPIIYPALGLSNEAGEVLGKIKKLLRDDGGVEDMTPGQRYAIADECRAERGTLKGSGDDR
jgi:hypothetical protein